MKCFDPVNIENKKYNGFNFKRLLVPCGHCAACLQRKRNVWSYRLSYELKSHEKAVFITLTYSDENVPKDGVSIRDCQLFLKRLRKTHKLRYYLVSEYGTNTRRPHYHAIIFGLSSADINIIDSAWSKGFVSVGNVNSASINYTTKYMITKDIEDDDTVNKPFSLMSRKPMLGSNYVDNMADWHKADLTRNYSPDKGGKKMPLHRGYREKIYDGIDLPDFSYDESKEEAEYLKTNPDRSYYTDKFDRQEHIQKKFFKQISKQSKL